MAKNYHYDQENDILAVHQEFDRDEKFKGNIDAGQLILDMSTKGRVRGIEIINATKFLKDFKVDLAKVENAKFDAQVNPTSIILGITFLTQHKTIPAKIAVPLPAR